MNKWSSINQFRQIVKYVQSQSEYHNTPLPTLMFRGTVKLHGTNGGIRRERGAYITQGRNVDLTVTEDNYGFANWLDTRLQSKEFKQAMDSMFDNISANVDDVVTIYGEWCGKGIQSKVAISQFEKRFVIFGARLNEDYVENTQSLNMTNVDDIDNVLSAPMFFVSVDFSDPKKSIPELDDATNAVETNCPYANLYGVQGIGEGVVWTCMEAPTNSDLWFKTKGEKHVGTSSDKKNITIEPEVLEKISDVVDYVLNAERLQQGLEHVESLDMKCIGQYLKWIGQDIQKEELDTIKANGLEWKQIAKPVNSKARVHFIQQLDGTIGL